MNAPDQWQSNIIFKELHAPSSLNLFFFPVLPLYIYLAVIDKQKAEMSEDYVEWDVHATNDALTPRVEYDDPLSQFSESEVSFFKE